MLKDLRDAFLRIDARSLGLFRVAMALALIGDAFGRLRWARDFYSNEGVLPNHNHLFNLRGKQEVWSLFHAVSTQGEAYVGLIITLLVYLGFLIGWHTRVFHLLSLVLLVSLNSRNILAEGVGAHAAIALLAFTAFLPCGSRFSLDSLRASLALRDERGAAALNDRRRLPEASVEAGRLPGWSPVTVAALGVLLQIIAIYACSYLQKSGDAWRDGSALYYALHVDRWVSGIGVRVRALGAGALGGWTQALRYVEILIPALLIVPAGLRWTRLAAAALMVFHGLTLGLLFDFGLYGWALVAAAALVLPPAVWDAMERSPKAARARTVIYDADCGFCLWICRLMLRADLRGHLTFQGNDDLDELSVRDPSGEVKRVAMPKEVTDQLVQGTVVVVGPKGQVYTRGRAVVEAIGALPLGWLAALLRLPGLAQLLDALYDAVAARRQRISVAMGKEACGIERPEDDAPASGEAAPIEASPARRAARNVAAAARELAAALVLAAVLAQTARVNPVPQALAEVPQGRVLAAITSWPRMMGRWDLLAPEPPRVNATVVVDARNRTDQAIDPFTGAPAQVDLAARGPLHLGQMWADYLDRIQRPEYEPYQRAFRDYLGKGGVLRSRTGTDPLLSGLDAYWVVRPIPPPGGADAGPGEREKLFSHGRGGLGAGMEQVPLTRPVRR